MEGSPEYLEPAKELYKEALKNEKDPLYQGFILNNLGMTNFYSFVIKSSEVTDPQGSGLDALKPIIENFEDCIFNLKKAVHAFEQFDKKFELITNSSAEKFVEEVDLELVNQKLFIDEFFELKLGKGEVIPVNPKSYDIKQNHANE